MVDKVQNFPDPLSYYIFGQEEIFILKTLAQCLYNFTMYVPDMGIWWVWRICSFNKLVDNTVVVAAAPGGGAAGGS